MSDFILNYFWYLLDLYYLFFSCPNLSVPAFPLISDVSLIVSD